MIMLSVLIAYGTITHFLGTHLWGCFIAGMSFACIDQEGHIGHAHHVWVRQTKRYTSWMIRIFFACTVAFSIPIAELLSIESFLKGSIMGIGPCVLTKVLCAPCMGSAKWVVGWAMVGRAEFAYLIAQMAAAGSMIDEKTFSICIWALLYATILAPFIFRVVLNKYIKNEGIQVNEGDAIKLDGNEDDYDDAIFAKAHETSRGPSSNMGNLIIGKPATPVEAALAEGIAAAKAAKLEASPCEGSPAKVDRRGSKAGGRGGRQHRVSPHPPMAFCAVSFIRSRREPLQAPDLGLRAFIAAASRWRSERCEGSLSNARQRSCSDYSKERRHLMLSASAALGHSHPPAFFSRSMQAHRVPAL